MEREVRERNETAARQARLADGDASRQAKELSLPGTESRQSRQRLHQRIAVALLVGLCAVGVFGLLRASPSAGQPDDPQPLAAQGMSLFQGWTNPDVVLVLSGEQHGYLQPCGCSRPQYGGLARRFNFVQSLKKKGWPVVALDVGDIAQKVPNPQYMLKYRYSMKSLKHIGYSAVGIGKNEIDLPLTDAIAEYTLNHPEPKLLAGNLLDPKTDPLVRDNVRNTIVLESASAPKVGVIGLVGRSAYEQVQDPKLHFLDNGAEVIKGLAEIGKQQAAVTVLLYHGSSEEAVLCAKHCAGQRAKNRSLPELDVVLCLSEHSEPPAAPLRIDGLPTQIINVGHKGRYVGVLGVFRTGRPNPPYEFKYQLVSIGPEYETPQGQEENNPIMALMEEYTKEVKLRNLIEKYPTSPHEVQVAFPKAEYVGSESCLNCHPHAFKIWKKSHPVPHSNRKLSHSTAYDSLVQATNPSLRQFDGECIKCHVVGFEHPTGYGDALRANDKTTIHLLKDVGCESCHGPCSEHLEDYRKSRREKRKLNPDILAVINPWKATKEELDPKTPPNRRQELRRRRMRRIDFSCQTCHDIDNDVHWDFETKWPKIIHMTPK